MCAAARGMKSGEILIGRTGLRDLDESRRVRTRCRSERSGHATALRRVPSEHVVGYVPGYRNPWRSGILEVVGRLCSDCSQRHRAPDWRVTGPKEESVVCR
jgi:hypothetical protein